MNLLHASLIKFIHSASDIGALQPLNWHMKIVLQEIIITYHLIEIMKVK
jgi:hypothetical protein